MSKVPEYASDVPFIPVNWNDRDAMVGRLMEILEAVLPGGKQLEATKRLVKTSLSQFFMQSFNNQFEILQNIEKYQTARNGVDARTPYQEAMWETAQKLSK